MSNNPLDHDARTTRRSRIRVASLVVAVLGICGAAVGTGAAMTGRQAADGPVQVSIAGATSSAPGATTPVPTATTPLGTVAGQTPTTVAAPPTVPALGGGAQIGGQPVQNQGGSNGSGGEAAVHTSPPAAPAKTSPPAPKPVTIGGQLTCSSGKSIEGVWVSTTTGSGYAPWQGLGNNVSKYWYTLPESEPYSVHVGCGGTQQYWAVACYGPQVTNPSDSFECFDVDGASGYETCKVT